MSKQFLKDAFGWGFILWLIGYILGIVLFPFVQSSVIGWVIMPFGVMITLWVLWTRIKSTAFRYYLYLALVWAMIAVIGDYFLLVRIFNPADGYYKFDVFLYYALTLALPILIGYKKTGKVE